MLDPASKVNIVGMKMSFIDANSRVDNVRHTSGYFFYRKLYNSGNFSTRTTAAGITSLFTIHFECFWQWFKGILEIKFFFLAHLAKGNVSFCHLYI
jgi:hypothetical protein